MNKAKKGSKSKKKAGAVPMPVLRPNVAGVDLASKEHWVCGPPRPDGEPNVEVFGTITAELERMVRWLLDQDVESVAMESTHVYWIPLYELLESNGIEVQLVNARQLHNVPSHKTDMLDCQWLQRLHSCGLLRGSFRPDDAICRLRAIKRHSSNLVAERTRAVQWMQKSLDQMNVQVHRAVTDITGKTGMRIVRAIVDGERDPVVLAGFRDRRCNKSVEQIAEHLRGSWRQEHLFTLASSLRLYDMLEAEIARCGEQLREEMAALAPSERHNEVVPKHPNPTKESAIKRRGDQELRTELWRFAGVDLTRIDGISADCAMVLLTEIGLDLTCFPTEKEFVSWLRLCPRRPISGGKQLRKRPNSTGANRASGVLRMAALSLTRSKSALGAYYRRIASRKDGKVALFAVARKIAQWVYRMLRYGQDYVDEGAEAYNARFEQRRLAGIERAAKQMGYTLVPQLATG